MAMIQVSGKHRVVGVPAQPQLQNLFPQARVEKFNGHDLLLLPHGYQETVMLRNLGIEVPAPILHQYEWPGDKRPFNVQRWTAAAMTTNQRFYCLNGMGTGKTRAAIWAYDYLRGNNIAKRALVVAPLSTLDHVWRREVFRTCPHLSVGVLHNTDRKKRLEVLEQDHDIYVINTDGIKVLAKELLARKDIDTFILDELALFRNAGSDRNKVARKLAERMTWVWGLTGSPTPNEPTDAWGQCKIVTPHTVPSVFGRFKDLTMFKVTQFKYVPKKDAYDHVFSSMQPAARFTLDDVVELPDVVERTIDVSMGSRQNHVYEEVRKHSYAAIQQHTITAVNAGAALNKLLQISLGYVYTRDGTTVALDNDRRLQAIVDAVMSTDRKVLIFVPFTHALEAIHKKLTAEKIDCALVHGQTAKKQRDYIFNAFQGTTKFKAICAHPGCMSHGLTLTAADTVIWAGPTTSLETFEQANARIRRVGQDHKQQIIMFQASAVEKKMYARLRAKQQVQENILDLFEEATPEGN
jgi:SNF2 family DNA or RNA helicase